MQEKKCTPTLEKKQLDRLCIKQKQLEDLQIDYIEIACVLIKVFRRDFPQRYQELKSDTEKRANFVERFNDTLFFMFD